jgi:hypothetical protein
VFSEANFDSDNFTRRFSEKYLWRLFVEEKRKSRLDRERTCNTMWLEMKVYAILWEDMELNDLSELS